MNLSAHKKRLLITDYRFRNNNSEIGNQKSKFSTFGFTLVEILVAMTILATLVGGVVLSLNPIAQINKSQDAQRVSDIQAVKTALELYYNDHKCYPTAVPFGNEWHQNNTVYMKEVPQDPKCKVGEADSMCYRYRTDDASSCPQWNVVFAQLSKDSSLTNTCALSSLSQCVPNQGYAGKSWACTLSGAVNCDYLFASSLKGGSESVSPTPTPTAVPSATPTPTPTPPAGSATMRPSHPAGTNPDVYEVTVMPLAQYEPYGQAIRVLVDDEVGNVTSVKLDLISDGDVKRFTLTRQSGTAAHGTWVGGWGVEDTYCNKYGFVITATDDQVPPNVETTTLPVDVNMPGWCD